MLRESLWARSVDSSATRVAACNFRRVYLLIWPTSHLIMQKMANGAKDIFSQNPHFKNKMYVFHMLIEFGSILMYS